MAVRFSPTPTEPARADPSGVHLGPDTWAVSRPAGPAAVGGIQHRTCPAASSITSTAAITPAGHVTANTDDTGNAVWNYNASPTHHSDSGHRPRQLQLNGPTTVQEIRLAAAGVHAAAAGYSLAHVSNTARIAPYRSWSLGTLSRQRCSSTVKSAGQQRLTVQERPDPTTPLRQPCRPP